MIESLLSAPKRNGQYAINLSWKDAAVGSQDIVDLAGNIWTPGNKPYSSQVVNDASRGKVFRSYADVPFTTPITTALFLSRKSFTIEFEVMCGNVGSHSLGGTGDYNQGISSGIGLNLGQFAANYYQAFLMGPGTAYDRLYPAAARTDKWTRVLITRTWMSGFKMELFHDDESSTVPFATHTVAEIDIGNGSGYWQLFKQANTPSGFFNGYLNFFRVSIKG